MVIVTKVDIFVDDVYFVSRYVQWCIKITRGLRSFFFFLICFKKTCRYGCSSEIKLIKSKNVWG